MTQKEALNELKYILDRYEPFFLEWVKTKHCSLSEQNLQLIESHIKSKFVIDFHKMFMAHNQPKNISPVVEKLIADYSAYNAWVIDWFFTSVHDLCKGINADKLLEAPLESLNIAEELKTSLLKLNLKNIHLILAKRHELTFVNSVNFAIMLEFLQIKSNADRLKAVPGNTLNEKI